MLNAWFLNDRDFVRRMLVAKQPYFVDDSTTLYYAFSAHQHHVNLLHYISKRTPKNTTVKIFIRVA